MEEPQKSDFLISSTAWLLIVGFFFEFPLTRDANETALAHLYQMFSAVLFLFTGIGLVKRRRFGYLLLMFATALTSIETLSEMWHSDSSGILTALSDMMPGVQLLDAHALRLFSVSMGILTLLSYWGFAAYVHYRRDWFR